MQHASIVELLSGERGQLGHAETAASDVLRHNDRFGELFEAMLNESSLVRARAADATDRVARVRPDLLVPYRKRLIAEAGEVDQAVVRRHVAQMLSLVKLEPKERSKAIALLERYLKDEHAGLVTAAMQTLVDFARDDAHLRKRMLPVFATLIRTATPGARSLRTRILARLEPLRREHR